LPFVLLPERLHGIRRHRGRRGYVRQRAAIRSPELVGPIRAAANLIALLVHRAM